MVPHCHLEKLRLILGEFTLCFTPIPFFVPAMKHYCGSWCNVCTYKQLYLCTVMQTIGVGLLCSFKLDLGKKVCTSYGAVDRASVEFPTTHPYRHGMKGTRYSYLMASDRKNCNLPYRDVVKVLLVSMCVHPKWGLQLLYYKGQQYYYYVTKW